MQHKRSGFTIILAIWILVAMTSIMALMLSFSSQTLSQTTSIYVKEQAQLLSKSATEYALLAISAHDRNTTGNCINSINSTYSPNNVTQFDINSSIKYIGMGNLAGLCDHLIGAQNINTAESNGTIIIDTYVTARNKSTTDPIIRYHRRTLQKP